MKLTMTSFVQCTKLYWFVGILYCVIDTLFLNLFPLIFKFWYFCIDFYLFF